MSLDKTVDKIDKLLEEIKQIQNGAIVNPKTNEIVKDKEGNIRYYRDNVRIH